MITHLHSRANSVLTRCARSWMTRTCCLITAPPSPSLGVLPGLGGSRFITGFFIPACVLAY